MSLSNATEELLKLLSSRLFATRTSTALTALAVYVAACRSMRFLRRDRKHAQYPYKTREDFAKMTTEHAWEINRYVMSLEFPFLIEKALQFALFRTYGIPTIAKLLCETRQLSEPQNVSRRYEDTRILIVEFLTHSPTSERANAAIARMNYLHNMYQRSGKISNDDMLYTLSLFVLEVERWVRLYEWRKMTDMEICALGTLWRSIGAAQNIDFSPLAHGPNDFRDGFEFFEDLRSWAHAYEERAMVPDPWNHKLAEQTTFVLLCNLPWFMQSVGRQAVVALMDERLRKAMMYDPAPSLYYTLIPGILRLRAFFLTYLSPPRPYCLRFRTVSDDADPKTGRYYSLSYENEPWYVKSTFWTRNSPSSWYRWLTGRPYPGSGDFQSEGYNICAVGPKKFEKVGLEECEREKERCLKEGGGRGGCPFR